MTIYTRRGDAGRTDLGTAARVSKASARVEAYGTVDECNAHVGAARPTGHDDVDEVLVTVQQRLHIVQAQLSAPGRDGPALTDEHVDELEGWIDAFDAELEPLRSFVLPGGTAAAARLHVARTVCRRAERRTVALAEAEGVVGSGDVDDGAGVDSAVLAYLNRLSDGLFVLARVVNAREGVDEPAPSY